MISIILILSLSASYQFSSNLTDHECEIKTDMILSHLINNTQIPSGYDNIQKLALYSGSGLNELGDYSSCLDLNYTSYYILNMIVQQPLTFQYGLCYFKECDVTYLNNSKYHFVELLKSQNITINPDMLQITDPIKSLSEMKSNYFIGMIIVVTIIILLLSLSIIQCCVKVITPGINKNTLIYDIEKDKDRRFLIEDEGNSESFIKNFLSIFDFFQNASKVFEITNSKSSIKALRIFDGIRFFSTGWVVYGHTFLIPLFIGLKNVINISLYVKKFEISFLGSALFAVDVFFYMSGFLFYLGFQKYLNKSVSKMKILFMALIHRYIRLLPLYLFLIFGITYILPFLGNTPNYYRIDFINYSCKEYFWTNLLYINNLYKFGSLGMCAGITWYLANDMQFFIVSIVIFLCFNNGKIQKVIRNVIILIIFIFSLVFQMIDAYQNQFRYNDFLNPGGNGADFFNDFYIKPWARVTPYLLGIYFCEIYLETPIYREDKLKKDDNFLKRLNEFLINNDIICLILFIFALILINFCVCMTYITNNFEVSYIFHSFFLTFNKTLFIVGLGIIVHLTFLGKFIFIYRLLSFNLFTIISRITYGVYMIHYYVIAWVFFSLGLTYYSFHDYFFNSLGIFSLTIIISFFVSLLLESPIINLIKKFTKE